MSTSPGKIHYATAVPFGSYSFYSTPISREEAYTKACTHNKSNPSYWRPIESPHQIGMGGGSQAEIENWVIRECEVKNNRTCIVILYNQVERCRDTFNTAYTREEERVNQRRESAVRATEDERTKRTQQMSQTCLSFGFKPNTTAFSNCILEMHNSLAQIEAIRDASNRQESAALAANAEARKLQEFEQGIMLLQNSSRTLDSTQSNRQNTKCRFNTITKTIVCN